MQIATLTGTSTDSALEAIYGDEEDKKRKETQQQTSGVHSWQQDRVSLSPEAMQASQAMFAKPEASPSDETVREEAFAPQEEEASQGAASKAPAGPGGPSTAEIANQINELQQKLSQIQSSSMPDATKEAMTSTIQNQINQLMQQLQALRMNAA